ncbi:MAG: hypothetical protein LAO79_20915 [Acidobacteriia bacterium]|nr:hypothetical protein [Terriglobia bacterium]
MSTDIVEALILDLLEWLHARERTYSQTMDAWRTSCPRLTVWEDANDRGLIRVDHEIVGVSEQGLALLQRRRAKWRGSPRGNRSV